MLLSIGDAVSRWPWHTHKISANTQGLACQCPSLWKGTVCSGCSFQWHHHQWLWPDPCLLPNPSLQSFWWTHIQELQPRQGIPVDKECKCSQGGPMTTRLTSPSRNPHAAEPCICRFWGVCYTKQQSTRLQAGVLTMLAQVLCALQCTIVWWCYQATCMGSQAKCGWNCICKTKCKRPLLIGGANQARCKMLRPHDIKCTWLKYLHIYRHVLTWRFWICSWSLLPKTALWASYLSPYSNTSQPYIYSMQRSSNAITGTKLQRHNTTEELCSCHAEIYSIHVLMNVIESTCLYNQDIKVSMIYR